METPTIVKRKIYAVGDGGLSVLLPPSWVRAHGLKPRDEVLLIADDRITIELATPERIREAHKVLTTFVKGAGNHDG